MAETPDASQETSACSETVRGDTETGAVDNRARIRDIFAAANRVPLLAVVRTFLRGVRVNDVESWTDRVAISLGTQFGFSFAARTDIDRFGQIEPRELRIAGLLFLARKSLVIKARLIVGFGIGAAALGLFLTFNVGLTFSSSRADPDSIGSASSTGFLDALLYGSIAALPTILGLALYSFVQRPIRGFDRIVECQSNVKRNMIAGSLYHPLCLLHEDTVSSRREAALLLRGDVKYACLLTARRLSIRTATPVSLRTRLRIRAEMASIAATPIEIAQRLFLNADSSGEHSERQLERFAEAVLDEDWQSLSDDSEKVAPQLSVATLFLFTLAIWAATLSLAWALQSGAPLAPGLAVGGYFATRAIGKL